MFNVNEDDVEQHVPFYLSLIPLLSPPTNLTHDRKHQKKKLRLHSCQTKPSKLNLISPLPDCRFNSVHHSLEYDREQSYAYKSSADSNHTSSKKHLIICCLNFTISTKQYTAKMKMKGRGVVNSVSPANSKFHFEPPLTLKWIFQKPTVSISKQKVSPTLPVQKAYSVQVKKKKILIDILDEIPEA